MQLLRDKHHCVCVEMTKWQHVQPQRLQLGNIKQFEPAVAIHMRQTDGQHGRQRVRELAVECLLERPDERVACTSVHDAREVECELVPALFLFFIIHDARAQTQSRQASENRVWFAPRVKEQLGVVDSDIGEEWGSFLALVQ